MNFSDNNPLPLVLGAAQLGMDYGIANRKGKPSFDKAIEIVATAWDSGIRFFDTAQAYGNSEEILGMCFKELESKGREIEPSVISKINPAIPLVKKQKILDRVDQSIENLGLEKLWGLLLHRETLLDGNEDLIRQLSRSLKSNNKIENFGVSVYSLEKAFKALDLDEIDIIQLPFNIFDQRALDFGLFEMSGKKRKRLFIRSIYLQGLLLLEIEQIPEPLRFCIGPIKNLIDFSRVHRISRKQLAFGFAVKNAEDAFIIFGAESPEQVNENIMLYRAAKGIDLPCMKTLSNNEPRLINPSLWYK